MNFPDFLHVLSFLVFTSFLLLLSWNDIKTGLLPDKINAVFGAAGLLFLAAGCLASMESALGGGFLGGCFLLALRLLSHGGLGLGDVKLGAVLGLWLGFPGIVLALFLAFLSGGVIGSFLLFRKNITRKTALPFGPFLAFGGIVSFLYGKEILEFYGSVFS